MIRLIRIDGIEILLNPDRIHLMSPHPEAGTLIRFLDGEEIQVKNSHGDITSKIRACIQGKRSEKNSGKEKNSTGRSFS